MFHVSSNQNVFFVYLRILVEAVYNGLRPMVGNNSNCIHQQTRVDFYQTARSVNGNFVYSPFLVAWYNSECG